MENLVKSLKKTISSKELKDFLDDMLNGNINDNE